jgi:hypothetical protein
MKKISYLLLFVFIVITSCKKSNTSESVEFKFTKLEGNTISATKGIVKLEWQDSKNSQWNIIVHNLTTGVIKTVSTSSRSITDSINLNDTYNYTPTALVVIDTINPCGSTKLPGVRIATTGDVGFTSKYCPPLSIISYSAFKTSASQANIAFGWTDSGNTSWDLKITNVTLGTPAQLSTVTLTEGNLNFPLNNTQLIEVIGKQNNAKVSFNVIVNSDSKVIYSNF